MAGVSIVKLTASRISTPLVLPGINYEQDVVLVIEATKGKKKRKRPKRSTRRRRKTITKKKALITITGKGKMQLGKDFSIGPPGGMTVRHVLSNIYLIDAVCMCVCMCVYVCMYVCM